VSIVTLVVAVASNGVIGSGGALPWRIPEDLRRFKALTMGKPCVMGRKTWESLPKKPLPGRTNIVVTRDKSFRADEAIVVHSLEDAFAQVRDAAEVAIIGGAEIFRAALPYANRIDLTEVHAEVEGDTKMPAFDRDVWKETARENHVTADGLCYSFVTLERCTPEAPRYRE
jgi:dihydrofolate reductase